MAVPKSKGKSKSMNKSKANAKPHSKDNDDDALLAAAVAQATWEREALAKAAAAEAARQEAVDAAELQRLREEADAAAVRGALPEDKPVVQEMPALVVPSAITAEPSLLSMLQRTDPTASIKHEAKYGSGAPTTPKDFTRETARERELRLREARARMKMARKAHEHRRGGKKVLAMQNYAPPAVYYGDETTDEIATRPQLIQEYVKRYAEWLVDGMKGTTLLDNVKTCPDQFALLFRFDTTLDPVCRHPQSKLGSQLDVLIVCYQRVLHFVWSDYADGLLQAALRKDEAGRPLLDIVMSPFNVLDILAGGKRPTGLGTRITRLEELAKMPYLNAEFYPHGIPAELVLKKLPWGADLGAEGAAERVARAVAADGDDALDSDEDEDSNKAAAPDSSTTAAIRAEVRALGRTRFPLSQAILDAFQPDYEAVAPPVAGGEGSNSDTEDSETDDD